MHAELDEIQYHLLVAEFDQLWARPPARDEGRRRERMDQMMRLIEAFEATRRMASSA
ncbi:hypothetical protein Herbaro_05710 [Herbaspirillum sp. WKF16]|uniref:hypothetical protein n=1 Tax=Herbaspirillum sp. WKF16 TaxID=3028312 RepID=UPI0023AA0AFD|nr:hypothetical protein [Herbaspirillum sp. WKF16]WDZ97286.1 hypothetical protein Herbaro_05710 [Herbaspirillum sp. WKF16]